MGKLYVVGDIHGNLGKFKNELGFFNNFVLSDDKVIFVGDYIDRGKESLEVIQELIKFKDKYPTILLKGNHESMFLEVINYFKSFNPYNVVGENVLFNNYVTQIIDNHLETFYSFIRKMPENDKQEFNELIYEISFGTHREQTVTHLMVTAERLNQLCVSIEKYYKDEIQLLENMPIVVETDKYIISHSGGNKDKGLNNNTKNDWLNSRNYVLSNETNKYFIVGHESTEGDVEINSKIRHIFVDTGLDDNGYLGIYESEYKEIDVKELK